MAVVERAHWVSERRQSPIAPTIMLLGEDQFEQVSGCVVPDALNPVQTQKWVPGIAVPSACSLMACRMPPPLNKMPDDTGIPSGRTIGRVLEKLNRPTLTVLLASSAP